MSTRGNIAIKLNSSDRVSTLKYNPDVLPAVRRKNNIGDVEAEDKPYLQIYNHHDSYPSHLGKILLNHYNSYEKALNLILAGYTSSVGEWKTDAYAELDDWDDVKPDALDEPSQDEEYLYVFEDNQWFIQGKAYSELTPLTEEIIAND